MAKVISEQAVAQQKIELMQQKLQCANSRIAQLERQFQENNKQSGANSLPVSLAKQEATASVNINELQVQNAALRAQLEASISAEEKCARELEELHSQLSSPGRNFQSFELRTPAKTRRIQLPRASGS